MSNSRPSVIFMGTPDFAVPSLEALLADADFEVRAVVTQEDKPVGRAQVLSAPAVKVCALAHQVPVLQPIKVREISEQLAALKPDLIVVVAYGQIIPQNILDIPKFGCINVHASLLPKYRGAACLQAAILNGDSETGVTIMKMEAGLDTGPILEQFIIPLTGRETLGDLHDEVAALAHRVLPSALKDYLAGNLIAKNQDDALASYYRTIKKENGRLDFTKSAQELERQIRAYTPWPGTFALTDSDNMLKIVEVSPEMVLSKGIKPGELFLTEKNLCLATTDAALQIEKLQLAGGKVLSAKEFLAGHQDFVGKVLK